MVKINRVHMNYENPLIGAEEMPQFGWEIESSKRDVVQKSYQLQISENEKFEELVYDSGVVWSEESAHIRPQDVKLQSARKYPLHFHLHIECGSAWQILSGPRNYSGSWSVPWRLCTIPVQAWLLQHWFLLLINF